MYKELAIFRQTLMKLIIISKNYEVPASLFSYQEFEKL